MLAEVQDKVAVMREMMREQELGEEHVDIAKAREALEVIPDILWDSFEANVAKAKDNVRRRVDDVIQGLENREFATNAEMFAEMRALPAEVQQIAGEAFHAAVQESKVQAQQQFEHAMQKVPDESDVLRTQWQMVKKATGSHVDREFAARTAAVEPAEQAMAAVKDQEQIEGVVANQVVADLLLRAKAAAQDPQDGALQMPQLMTNAGSIGHPELCSRPCLYYAAANCTNGNNCDFCHLPHSKRPAHLDKRHRDMLRDMPFDAVAALVLPVVREKVQALAASPETLRMVDALGGMCHEGSNAPDPAHNKPSEQTICAEGPNSHLKSQGNLSRSSLKKLQRNERTLVVALKAMSLRLLLTSLHRSMLPESPQRKQALDHLLQHLRKTITARSEPYLLPFRPAHRLHQ